MRLTVCLFSAAVGLLAACSDTTGPNPSDSVTPSTAGTRAVGRENRPPAAHLTAAR